MDKNFMNQVKNQIKEYLPKNFEDASVKIEETIDHNDHIKQGLLIHRKGENVTPKIYLEQYEKRYKKGELLEKLLREIADIRVSLDLGDESINLASMNYDFIKRNLIFSMCDPEMNRRQMEHFIFTEQGNYVAMYRVLLALGKTRSASVLITEQHLKAWNVTKEQLYEDAIQAENARGFQMNCMRDWVRVSQRMNDELCEPFELENLLNGLGRKCGDRMYVLTNHIRHFGAGAIMHAELLEKAGNILDSNFFVLPTSIHDLVLVPDDGHSSQNEWEERLRKANETESEPEKIFSNHVSFYDNTQKALLPEKSNKAESQV